MTEQAEDASSEARVTLVTAGDPNRLTGGYLYNRHILAALRNSGFRVAQVVLPENPSARAASLRLALLCQKPALVIVDSIALAELTPHLSWLSKKLRARVLALMHMLPSDLADGKQREAARQLESRLLPAADHVVAVSPSLSDQLQAAGVSRERLTVILPGRDALPVPEVGLNVRQGDRFLCVANWSESKGVHLVVGALASLRSDLHLDLVGEEADPGYAHRLRRSIDELGVRDQVQIHGPLEGKALASCYTQADVFVLPSRSEGFGTVYAEAMSFGLPIIACRIGPLPWLVEEGCGILVPPGDSAALAEAMAKLRDSPSLRKKMGEAARQRALRLPTWQESCDNFCNLVLELTGR